MEGEIIITKKYQKLKNKGGRPSKLTKELQAEFVSLVKAGNYIETACAIVGINKTTYYDWIKKANASTRNNKYVSFRDAVIKAQAWSEARDVAIISKHAETSWQAAAWKLERKYPSRWGRKQKVKNRGNIKPERNFLGNEDKAGIKTILDLLARTKERIEEDDKLTESKYVFFE